MVYKPTFRYANRAKNIKNKPRINEDPKDALLREYQEEINRLKQALEKRRRDGGKKKKRRKRVGANGEGECVCVCVCEGRELVIPVINLLVELSEEDESGGEEEGEGGRDDCVLKAMQTKLEAEKQAILQNKELLEEVGSAIVTSPHIQPMEEHFLSPNLVYQRKGGSSSQMCSSMWQRSRKSRRRGTTLPPRSRCAK